MYLYPEVSDSVCVRVLSTSSVALLHVLVNAKLLYIGQVQTEPGQATGIVKSADPVLAKLRYIATFVRVSIYKLLVLALPKRRSVVIGSVALAATVTATCRYDTSCWMKGPTARIESVNKAPKPASSL